MVLGQLCDHPTLSLVDISTKTSQIIEKQTVCSTVCSGFHQNTKAPNYLTLCEDNPLVKRGFPAQRASNETIFMSWCLHFSVNGLLTRYAKLRVAHASRMPGTFSPTRWRGNVPGIPGACATRNFMHMARGPWANLHLNAGNVYPHHKIRSLILKLTNTASALTRTGHFWSNI